MRNEEMKEKIKKSAAYFIVFSLVFLSGIFSLSFTGQKKADLRVIRFTFHPQNPTTADQIQFKVVVQNIGGKVSGRCKAQFRIGGESHPPVYPIPSLKPGGKYTLKRQVSLKVARRYMCTVIVDIDNVVDEASKKNNSKKIVFDVRPPGLKVPRTTPLKDRETPPVGNGKTFSLKEELYSTGCNNLDKDCDGLLDRAEDLIANAFRPCLIFDENEGCADGFVILYQLTPDKRTELRLRFMFLYKRDCPGPGQDAHNGDSQSYSFILKSNDNGRSWQVKNSSWEWSDVQSDGMRHINLYISKAKHSIYKTKSECESSKHRPSSPVYEDCGGVNAGLVIYGARYNYRENRWERTNLTGNVGEPPYGYRFYSLEPYGFPNEDVYSGKCFCGGLKQYNDITACGRAPRKCADPVGEKWHISDNKNSILPIKEKSIQFIHQGGSNWGKDNYATSIAFGNFDNDRAMEIVIGRNAPENHRFFILDDKLNNFETLYRGGESWGKDNYTTEVATGDIDGDGRDEIIIGRKATKNHRYFVLDDKLNKFKTLYTGGESWGKDNYTTAVAAGDIDGDGKDEIIIGRKATKNYMRYQVLDDKQHGFTKLYEGGESWGSDNYPTSIAAGDIDNDGRDEITIGRKAPEDLRYFILDDRSNGFKRLYEGGNSWGEGNYVTFVAMGDIDGDGRDEIGIARKVSGAARKYMKYSILDDKLNSFKVIQYGGATWGKDNYATVIAFGNIDRDSNLELAVGRKAPENYRYLFADQIKCAKSYIYQGDSWGGDNYATSIAFGDVDGDGIMEAGMTRKTTENYRYCIIKFFER